jgi:26S proteasome regulatory subunit T1
MPSATGENWEKYSKNYADDEEPEKKITPLTDEYVVLIVFDGVGLRTATNSL